METSNFANTVLYQFFAVINFAGCLYAICRLWQYFHPSKHFPRALVQYVHFMILCLFCFAVYQLNTFTADSDLTPWTMKIGVMLYFIKSIIFTRVAETLRQPDYE